MSDAWAAVHDDISFDPEPDARVRLSMLHQLGDGFAITKSERAHLISDYLLPTCSDADWCEMQLLAAALFTAAERRKYLKEIFSLENTPPLLLPRRVSREGQQKLGNGLRVDISFAREFRRTYIHGAGPIVLPGFMPDEYSVECLDEELLPMRFASEPPTVRFLAGSALRVGLVSAALLRDSGATPTLSRSPASMAAVKTSAEIIALMPSLQGL